MAVLAPIPSASVSSATSRESRVPQQLAHPVPNVLPQELAADSHPEARTLCFTDSALAHLHTRSAQGIGMAHAAAHFCPEQPRLESHSTLHHLSVSLFSVEERFQSAEKSSQQASWASFLRLP